MSFEKIIGNYDVKKFLDNQIENGKNVHSYLFIGIEGIGKKIFAREFSKKLLCNKQEESNECESCIKYQSRESSRFSSN